MSQIIIVVLCLLLNALIAGAEMAFVAVSRPSLRELVRQGHKKADVLLRLRERPERTLAVMQNRYYSRRCAGRSSGWSGSRGTTEPGTGKARTR